jgi:diguanylate cyclase (GGDEF)-like protein
MNLYTSRVRLPSPVGALATTSSVGRGTPEERAESLPPPPVCARRVLLIEDERPSRDDLVEVLRDDGYAVCALTAHDPVLDFITRASPDIVLLATSRRRGAGIELDLCGEIRRLDPAHLTPILLFASEDCGEAEVVAGLQSGADDFVASPGRVAELMARVRVQLRNLRDRELLRWAREQRSSFRDEALTDALTRLPNRRAIDRALSAALRAPEATTVMLLDIDHFKQINDTWGHAAGDEVLRAIGATLGLCTRREDLVGRFGGEEFVVVLRGSLGAEVDILGDRYRQTVGAIVLPDDLGPTRVTVSVGISRWDGQSEPPTPARILQLADEALYEAKRAGRDRVRVSELPGQKERASRPKLEPEYALQTGAH